MQEDSSNSGRDTALWLLHITDNHLFADTHGGKFGVNSEASLRGVLKAATRTRQPDVLIDTGDIAHDSESAVYAAFASIVQEYVDCPIVATPGNHDLSEPFGQAGFDDAIATRGWRVTTVDTHVDGEVGGSVDGDQLRALAADLAHEAAHTLVFGHHPAGPVGSEWIDAHGISNGDEFLATLGRMPTVKAYVSGHVHQAFEGEAHGVQLMSTPSTCWQFKARSSAFAVDSLGPGWRWLALRPDGVIETVVERLTSAS